MPNYSVAATNYGPDIGLSSYVGGYEDLMQVSPQIGEGLDMYYDQATGKYKKWKRVQGPGGTTQLVPEGAVQMPSGEWSVPPAGSAGTTAQSAYPRATVASNGQLGMQVPFSNQVINPNDPNQRYQSVNITKDQGIASAYGGLMDSFKKGAADSMKGFDEWLGTFKTSLGDAFKQSKAATDPSQTIAELNSRQSQYDAALNQGRTDYADLNRRTAAAEQGIVQQAQDLIPQYDTAAQAAAERQLQLLQWNVSRYKAASGTPMSLGSSEQMQLAKGAADILVPMEQAKIQQRYNVLGQYAMPVAMDIANREQARIGTFNPAIAQQQFATGQATAQTVQQLKVITAQMARTDAVAFMQAMGVPVAMQQQILSGEIGQLGALSQLNAGNTYQGIQDVLGANPTQPVYASPATGPYPNAGRYTSGLPAYNAPRQVTPTTPVAPQAGGIQTNRYSMPTYNPFTSNAGSQTNSFYDPSTGESYDRTTGQVTSNSEGYVYNPLMHN